MSTPGMPRGAAWPLGLAQLINWGVTFYMPGALGQAIALELGWSEQRVFAGLSVALLTMGLLSPLSAWLIERLGPRRLLQLGAAGNALGCCVLALGTAPLTYYLAWIILGAGMRLSLYDALFSALTTWLGGRARPLIVSITLLGGLASSVFWPLGHALLEVCGWRSTLALYACLALLSGLLLNSLPLGICPVVAGAQAPTLRAAGAPLRNQLGYAAAMALIGMLSAGLSAHLPAILASFGVAVGWVALWGMGQTCARLTQALLRQPMSALRLNLWVGAGLIVSLAPILLSQAPGWVICVCLFGYGAMNGLATLLRASLPLELFAPLHYAHLQARLLVPAFLVSAAAPWFYAWLAQGFGLSALLWTSLGISVVFFLIAAVLAYGHISPEPASAPPARAPSPGQRPATQSAATPCRR